MATPSHPDESHDPSHHIRPWQEYLGVYFALLILMGATIGASYLNFGPFNIVVALIIAVMKTVLVVLFFMGVKYGTKLTVVWATIGFVWLLLMFGTLGDYVTRNWITLPKGW